MCFVWSVFLILWSPSFGFSPPDALHRAFKRLDADISLEAQVPLSNDLMKSTAIQVITFFSFVALCACKVTQFWYTCIIDFPGCICRLHCLCGSCWHRWDPRSKCWWLPSCVGGAGGWWVMERCAPFSRPQHTESGWGGADQGPAPTLRERHSNHRRQAARGEIFLKMNVLVNLDNASLVLSF